MPPRPGRVLAIEPKGIARERNFCAVTYDLAFFAMTIPAVLFAGISKGGFGSGAAFASSSILALVLDPALAVGLMLPLLMLMDVAALRAYWRKWAWPEGRLLILGSVPGILAGMAFYKITNADVFRFMIGAISLAFVIWQGAGRMGWLKLGQRPLPDWGGALAGAMAGFTSFVSHAGGPPAAVFLLSRPVTKTSYQATTVLVFWIINMLKAVPYGIVGIFTLESLTADLLLAPFAVVGTWLGVWLHNLVPERLFFGLTHVLLTLTGTKLIFDALT